MLMRPPSASAAISSRVVSARSMVASKSRGRAGRAAAPPPTRWSRCSLIRSSARRSMEEPGSRELVARRTQAGEERRRSFRPSGPVGQARDAREHVGHAPSVAHIMERDQRSAPRSRRLAVTAASEEHEAAEESHVATASRRLAAAASSRLSSSSAERTVGVDGDQRERRAREPLLPQQDPPDPFDIVTDVFRQAEGLVGARREERGVRQAVAPVAHREIVVADRARRLGRDPGLLDGTFGVAVEGHEVGGVRGKRLHGSWRSLRVRRARRSARRVRERPRSRRRPSSRRAPRARG